MDPKAELVAEHGCCLGKDLEVDMRDKRRFDPTDLGMRDPDQRAESTGAHAHSDARGPQLLPNAAEQEAGAASTALDGRFPSGHSATMPSRAHLALTRCFGAAHPLLLARLTCCF